MFCIIFAAAIYPFLATYLNIDVFLFQWAADTTAATGAATGAATAGFGAPTSTDWGAETSDWAAASAPATGETSTDWGSAPSGGDWA